MAPILVSLPAVVAAVSAAALAVALRGRRVDDHPVCRRCGFDLFGKPPGANVCSECGADLGRRRAVRVGNRVRRRRVMALAVPLLLASGGWLGLLGWGTARGTDWNRHKPVWWLARDAGGKDAAGRDAALAELARRVGEGKLTDGELADLTDRALAHQADTSQPWVARWGQLVEAAEDAGRLPAEKWKQYALNGFPLRLAVRPRVRRGDPIPVEYWADPPRVGSGRLRATYDVGPELHFAAGVIPNARAGTAGRFGSTSGAAPEFGGWQLYELPAALAGRISDGDQSIEVHYSVAVSDRGSPRSGRAGRVDDPDRIARAGWRLLPAGESSVALVTDPGRRAAAEAAVWMKWGQIGLYRPTGARLVFAAAPPMPMAFDVAVRQGGREWPLRGSVFFGVRRPPGLVGFSALGTADEVVWSDCPGLTAGRADVILRPTPTAAVRTTDAMEIWGGDILLKDVPVVDVVAAAQGAGAGQAQRVIRPASRPAAGVR